MKQFNHIALACHPEYSTLCNLLYQEVSVRDKVRWCQWVYLKRPYLTILPECMSCNCCWTVSITSTSSAKKSLAMVFTLGLAECKVLFGLTVTVNWLVKMTFLVISKYTRDAMLLAKTFVWVVDRLNEHQSTIDSDWGPQLSSEFWR